MSLTIRQRLYILSLVPLLTIALSMMYVTFNETSKLSQEQMPNAREAMMEMKQTELKSYLQIADTALNALKSRQAPLGKLRTSPAIWVSSEVLSGSPDF